MFHRKQGLKQKNHVVGEAKKIFSLAAGPRSIDSAYPFMIGNGVSIKYVRMKDIGTDMEKVHFQLLRISGTTSMLCN